jgi:hypothetical protein
MGNLYSTPQRIPVAGLKAPLPTEFGPPGQFLILTGNFVILSLLRPGKPVRIPTTKAPLRRYLGQSDVRRKSKKALQVADLQGFNYFFFVTDTGIEPVLQP